MGKTRLSPLQIIAHTGSMFPLAWLAWAYFSNNLTVNPIQTATQYTGRIGLTLLIFSLTCTPLNTLFKWHEALKVRRALGLYAFFYVMLHLLLLVGVDYGFAFDILWGDFSNKTYIYFGVITFLILVPLAFTSFKSWMKRLGRNWKRLHKLVYVASLLAVIHYILAQKGDVFLLRGNILLPMIYGVVVIILLTARISVVRKEISRASISIRRLFL
jgi:methionine sulfoxide reductase heme-binding subunit